MADYYPQQRLFREGLEMHPQYVLENGVDFAHFKYVHQTPIVPVFTRHDFDEPVSYVDFTITFEGDDEQTIEDVNSGVEAINGGLGHRGHQELGHGRQPHHLGDHPVDDAHLRRPLHGLHRPHAGRATTRRGPRPRPRDFGDEVIRQFTQDIHIWAHQRYSDPPALAELRVRGLHRNPQRGPSSSIPTASAAAPPNWLALDTRKARHRMSRTDKPIRVFQVATGNVGSEMIKRIADQPDLELIGVHCYSPDKVGRDAGELAGLAPNGVTATGIVEEIIAAKPDVLTFHGVFPDEDLYVKVLEAGIDIVTTADWITGWHRDTNHPHPSGKPVIAAAGRGVRARAGRRSTAPA